MIFFLFKDATDIEHEETETQDHEHTDIELTENSMGQTESQSSTSESTLNDDPLKAPADVVMSSNKKRKIEKKSNTEKRMDEAYNILKVMSKKPDQDECSLYTELLCRKLRTLNENTREIAMHKIDNIMYCLKQQQSRPPVVPSQSSLAHGGNFQYEMSSEVHHHHDSHSHLQSIPEFERSSHSSQPSPKFSPSPHSHSLSSPTHSPSPYSYSHSPSPYSYSQSSSSLIHNFPQSQLYSQPSPHSQPSLEDTLQENQNNETIIYHFK